MPIVTITARAGKSREFKDAVFDAIQDGLAEVGVPRANRFHRFIGLSAEDFRFGAQFPDARLPRTDDFLLVEILWSAGRTVPMKRTLLDKLAASLRAAGIEPENVMVYFRETAWENWACAGARLTHV